MQINQAKERILEIMKKEGQINSVQLTKIIPLSKSTITNHLHALHKANKIYISDWYRDKKNTSRPMFSVGLKMDVERPPLKGKYVPKKSKETGIFEPKRDEAASWMTHL